jgi:hypothetical protein
MTKSNYLKNYAESFTIFAQYQASDILDLDYCSIRVSLAEAVSPDDEVRLLELGWKKSGNGGYYKDERGGDYS